MNIKKAAATTVVVFVLLGTGVTAKAAYDWLPGHQNLQAVSDNIDKLVNKINSAKQAQQAAQQSANDLQNRLNDLQRQKDNEAANYQQQIQQKIDEINQKIAENQKQMADKQREIDDLNRKLADSQKGADTWYGDQLEKRTNVKGHLEAGDVEVIINKLRKEYAPTIEMTKS